MTPTAVDLQLAWHELVELELVTNGFGDIMPGVVYGRLVGQIAGHVVLRIAGYQAWLVPIADIQSMRLVDGSDVIHLD